jgi:hypothetical protein
MKTFVDVSIKNPCRICKKTDWCSVSPDGNVLLCRRIPNENEKIDKNGSPYWLWRKSNKPSGWRSQPVKPAIAAGRPPELGDPEELHSVYSALLDTLSLEPNHHQHLRDRGFTTDEISINGYRSLPEIGRARLCRSIVGKVGAEAISRTPGFFIKDGRFGKHWSLAGYGGILVPVRDEGGRICALRVRRNNGLTPRYSYISSAKYGGPAPIQFAHFPLGTVDRRSNRLRITEGELKADITSKLDVIPTVSVAGVSLWKFSLPYILRERRTVHVAFDSDAFTKPHVWRQLRSFVETLRTLKIETVVEIWDGEAIENINLVKSLGGHHVVY